MSPGVGFHWFPAFWVSLVSGILGFTGFRHFEIKKGKVDKPHKLALTFVTKSLLKCLSTSKNNYWCFNCETMGIQTVN